MVISSRRRRRIFTKRVSKRTCHYWPGWNRDEGNYVQFFGKDAPSKENYIAKVRKQFGDQAPDSLKLYPASTDEQMKQSADRLNSADFIAFGTWKWIELQRKTGDAAVYRYEFDRELPVDPASPLANRAYHSTEIEYVFGTLDSKKLAFHPEDYKLSDLAGSNWTNFAQNGNPNGAGLPQWRQHNQQDQFQVMHLSATSQGKTDDQRDQYLALDKVAQPLLQSSRVGPEGKK
jgi:para-nitrobenzyl esterase